MYNKIKRIGYLLSAVIILFFNIFVKCYPAFAAETALEQSYVVVNNWLNAAANNPNSNTFLTKVLGAAGAAAGLSALFGGDNPKEITKDFINEYQNMQNANLNALVVEPAKFAKYLLWDKPQEYLPSDEEVVSAIKSAMDKTGASLVIFADNATEWGENVIDNVQTLGIDTYLFYSDVFIEAFNEYISKHTYENIYYENISDIPIEKYNGGLCTQPHYYSEYITEQKSKRTYEIVQYEKMIHPDIENNYKNYSFYIFNSYLNPSYPKESDKIRSIGLIAWNNKDDVKNLSLSQWCGLKSKYNSYFVMKFRDTWYEEPHPFYDGVRYERYLVGDKIIMLQGEYASDYEFLNFYANFPEFLNKEDALDYFINGNSSVLVNPPAIPENADLVLPKTSPDLAADHPYALGDLEDIADGYADVIDKVLEGVAEGAIDLPLTGGIAIDDDGAVSIPNVGVGENVGTIDLPVTIPYPSVIPWDDVIPLPYTDNPAIDKPTTDDPAIDEPIEKDIDIDIDDDNGDPLLDLSQFFPFCLPYDFMSAIKLLSTDGEPPVFEIPLKYNVLGEQVQHTVVIDIMKPGTTKDNSNSIAFVKYLKWFQTIAFITALIFITIKITPH